MSKPPRRDRRSSFDLMIQSCGNPSQAVGFALHRVPLATSITPGYLGLGGMNGGILEPLRDRIWSLRWDQGIANSEKTWQEKWPPRLAAR
jgi:hypothetical protein